MISTRLSGAACNALDLEEITEENSIASPKAPVLANNHHSKHDKKSDRKSVREKKQSRKRDRAVMSSVVGMVAKTSNDEVLLLILS